VKSNSDSEFMIPRGEWKRLHDQIQENKSITGVDLKARIEVSPDAIVVRFDGADVAVEWVLKYL
jgi:hypothetical protein